MNTTETKMKFAEWLSAEEMHKNSKSWLTELSFIKDEHLFFEDLIKSFTIQLLGEKDFIDIKEIIDAVNRSEKENNMLIEAIKVHESDLQIMIDGIDQPKEEEGYKKEHRELITMISDYLKNYKKLKAQLFEIISKIMKNEKMQRLLK